MEYKRIGLIVSAFLLCLLSACQMTGVTPAPQPPGAGIIANNPGGPIQVAPTASSGCNQLGCPYPAVCDKTSGVCTINQSQGPSAAVHQAPGAGIISNNPNPGSLLPPACSPPVPSVGSISSFCANQVAKLGGATFEDHTNLTVDGTNSWLVGDFIGSAFTCTLSDATSEGICSGPQNGTIQAMICSSCGGDLAASNAPHACAKGYVLDGQGDCLAANPSQDDPSIWCPPSTHYDNGLQNCADNKTNQLASPCPQGFPNYIPYAHQCWNNAEMVFNCQSFQIPLGECITPVKKIPGTGGQMPRGEDQ